MNPTYSETLGRFKTKSLIRGEVNNTIHKFAGDPRLMLASPGALILQVAHPTVSAGVKEHSDYLNAPWERLLRTLDFVYVMTFGSPEDMILMGHTIKDIHKTIRGTKPDGSKYSALEPEAYAWVHATLAYFFVKSHEVLGTPMTKEEVDNFWREWRDIGTLIHVKPGVLPNTWREFEGYFEYMIVNKLRRTPEVEDLLAVLEAPPPPHKVLRGVSWDLATIPVSYLAYVMSVGLMPESARTVLGLEWGIPHALLFKAVAKASKATTPIVKKVSPHMGSLYLKLRKASIKEYYGV